MVIISIQFVYINIVATHRFCKKKTTFNFAKNGKHDYVLK